VSIAEGEREPKLIRMWVLQIDDDEDDIEIFSTAVRLFDPAIQYRGAESMEEALQLFNSDGCIIPDVIFLDINMPRHSGFDCHAIFRRDPRFEKTRFFFLSTNINAREMPAGPVLMKKQHSINGYVEMLCKHLRPPPTSSSYADASYKYRPCLSAYDTIMRPNSSASRPSPTGQIGILKN
jgi:CheY-like chemotaxis protein